MSTAIDAGQQVSESEIRKAVGAAALGNALEWFDFGVYGYLAVTIGEVFFPSESTTESLLKVFGVFAAAFVVRPLGGLFFGPLGDKIGRNRVLATTILLMSGATFAIGLLPTYQSTGIWAPIGLLFFRMVQGFSTGGEYGGAATFMVEYAPDKQRGFLASWLEFGTLAGYAASAILIAALTYFLSTEAMHAWGWRIPFLCAGPLGIIGLYLRLKLEDTPVFQQLEQEDKVSRRPLREAFVQHWRLIFKCVGLVLVLNVAYYTVLKYLPSYLITRLGLSELNAMLLPLGILIGMMVLVTFIGRLSDRVGRKPVLLAACIGFILLSYPAFYLMSLGDSRLTFLGLSVLGFIVVLLGGAMPATLPAIFPTQVRYSGFAVSYNLSASLFGGTTPLVITYLISITQSDFIPAFYLMAAAAIAIIPVLLIRETANQPLPGLQAPNKSKALS